MSGLLARRLASVSRRISRPPVREARFWIVQAVVVGIAAFHLAIDVVSATPSAVPAGIPVALLLVPISYTALRYGLSGSAATAVWAALLWLPDLLLPRDRGHVGNDLIELALVIAVAVFVGYHIDAERLARASAQRARTQQQAAEARYRQLFETNAAPILVATQSGTILDANPAACALVQGTVIGRPVRDVLGRDAGAVGDGAGRVIPVSAPGAGLRHYRVTGAQVAAERAEEPLTQLVLEDVTEERAEGNRVHRFAELLLKVQEEERRRIAQELHDEPLQLLVHLARCLERLAGLPQTAAPVADGLGEARREALDIASRLRTVVAGLRPPALEQLGLAAALRGFVAGAAEAATVRAEMRVTGTEMRLDPGIELAAFRIAQEAVNNVIRHAGADQVLLTLAFGADGRLCLGVADDGRGFDPTALDRHLPAGRLGLLGMRERAALAGGQLTVRSAPGHGTIIEATFAGNGAPDDRPPYSGTPRTPT
jgi:two-component system sensor histidine kinase UhpB